MRAQDLTTQQLKDKLAQLWAAYEPYRAMGLDLNVSRGLPCTQQLELNMEMFHILDEEDCISEEGADIRNYGVMYGLVECRRLFSELLGLPIDNIIIGGNSSFNLIYDAFCRIWCFGTLGNEPWCRQKNLKFLCPVPGYDCHFRITEAFGFEMINIPMHEDGPDMDAVEALVADPDVKGMWCVPKYSNPSGCIYSDEVIERIARLKPAAPDFRVYWDNAYCEHFLYPEGAAPIANVFELSCAAGNPDLVYQFCSTSKITFPGAGVSAMAASKANLDDLKSEYKHRMIGHDKLNQLRHVLYLRDLEGLRVHMAKQADIMRPRFELVEKRFTEGLGDLSVASWTHPRGGYFVSFDGPEGSAKAVFELCAECGVTLTGAGATYPGGVDPKDSNIRIAPTYPTLAELDEALGVFVTCVKLVSARLARAARA